MVHIVVFYPVRAEPRLSLRTVSVTLALLVVWGLIPKDNNFYKLTSSKVGSRVEGWG